MRRGFEHLRWSAIAVAVVAGILVLTAVWWMGPGLFSRSAATSSPTVEATVTLPAPCTAGGAQETVHYVVDGKSGNGLLEACGHHAGELVSILLPDEPPAEGKPVLPKVTSADGLAGYHDPRRPVGLAMLALSCGAGATYAFLVSSVSRGRVSRGRVRRSRPAVA